MSMEHFDRGKRNKSIGNSAHTKKRLAKRP